MILLKKMLKTWEKMSDEEKLFAYNNEINNNLWSFDEVKEKFDFAITNKLSKDLLKTSCEDYNSFMKLDIGFVYSGNVQNIIEIESANDEENNTDSDDENKEINIDINLEDLGLTSDEISNANKNDDEENEDEESKDNVDSETEENSYDVSKNEDIENVNNDDNDDESFDELNESIKFTMDEIVSDVEKEISSLNNNDNLVNDDYISEKIEDLRNKVSIDDNYIIYSQHELCTLLLADEKYDEKEKERLIISAEKKIEFLQNLIDSSKDPRESFINTMLKNVTEAFAKFKEHNEI